MDQTKEIIRKVKKLEITTKHLVDGLITGNYHSIFKGQGIEFSESREYRVGDDIRSIDWKITARLNEPYIKEFIEERDLHVYFALDLSGSSSFGNNISKRKKALEIVASLMFAAMKNNDNVGLFLFTDEIEQFIPARKGRKHVLKAISTLVQFQPKSTTTNLSKSLRYISKVIKKRSIVFVISDFFDTDFVHPLKILKNKHDVIALRIIDQRELEIPDIGLIELEDGETGEQLLVDTSDEQFRKDYMQQIQKHEQDLLHQLRKIKIDMVRILTDEPFDIPLKKFFKIRLQRVMR
ncbi:MAG: DUF58 domain-containing protein [Candidatus Thermoplasmatota archaeon]|nr:DUF58 domain-containing protein [Candidatus Thermoplasmatota archaeon]MBS3802192.1 DUF58 domain-containing protein [Candidatus Thermoplasmatota archaeon]